MAPTTVEHLALAERNRNLARSLLGDEQPLQAAEWAAVVAFYAALHFVNAYLWERYGREPAGHRERNHLVRTDPVLGRCQREYLRLADNAYHARYTVGFQISRRDAQTLIDLHLGRVETIVQQALNTPPSSGARVGSARPDHAAASTVAA